MGACRVATAQPTVDHHALIAQEGKQRMMTGTVAFLRMVADMISFLSSIAGYRGRIQVKRVIIELQLLEEPSLHCRKNFVVDALIKFLEKAFAGRITRNLFPPENLFERIIQSHHLCV